jgi:hypothetical protein
MTSTIVKTISEDVKMTVESYRKGSKTFFKIMLNEVQFGKTGYARKYDAINQAKKYIEYHGSEKLAQMYANHKAN